MNNELFIARRIGSRGGAGGGSVMVRIATAITAVSVAVMVVALAVIFGFKHEITRRMTGLESHVKIFNLNSANELQPLPISLNADLERGVASLPGFVSMAPYAVRGGIIRTDEGMEGVALKGVDSLYDWRFLESVLVRGTVPRPDDSVRYKEVLLSEVTARELRLDVDDRVQMAFMEEGGRMRRDRFRVCGIFSSGFDELDRVTAFTELRNVQRLNGWGADRVSGYEIRIDDVSRLERFKEGIYEVSTGVTVPEGEALQMTDVRSSHRMLFDWLKTHDTNAAVILAVMLLVALLNMTAALLVIVLERRRMIGVLRTLGMSLRSVRRLFLWRAAAVAARGMAWGNAVGLALCALQRWTGALKLDGTGYFLSEVPVQWGPVWWITLNIVTFATIMCVMVLPAAAVARIDPAESMRYQ